MDGFSCNGAVLQKISTPSDDGCMVRVVAGSFVSGEDNSAEKREEVGRQAEDSAVVLCGRGIEDKRSDHGSEDVRGRDGAEL